MAKLILDTPEKDIEIDLKTHSLPKLDMILTRYESMTDLFIKYINSRYDFDEVNDLYIQNKNGNHIEKLEVIYNDEVLYKIAQDYNYDKVKQRIDEVSDIIKQIMDDEDLTNTLIKNKSLKDINDFIYACKYNGTHREKIARDYYASKLNYPDFRKIYQDYKKNRKHVKVKTR